MNNETTAALEAIASEIALEAKKPIGATPAQRMSWSKQLRTLAVAQQPVVDDVQSAWNAWIGARPQIVSTGALEVAFKAGAALRSTVAQGDAEAMARRFHEAYGRLAPDFSYAMRKETRDFDPNTPNGKLMIAVCAAMTAATPTITSDTREAAGRLIEGEQ